MRIGAMRAVAIGLALTTLLAACGEDDGGAAGTGDGTTSEESPSPEESPAAETTTVQLAESDLGSILVDADGMTLYLFESDTDGSSTCYDDCAASWPALIDDAPTGGEGVDGSLLGTTERDDGEVQVTYGGQPLYSFASDQAPGDVEGQGVGDVWFVVDAAGDAVVEEARTGPGY
jgi:predicted lipoprotein with Yx(FWY)xxD motif